MKNALVDALVPVVAESCKGVIGYIRHKVIGRCKEGRPQLRKDNQAKAFQDRSDIVMDVEDDVSR